MTTRRPVIDRLRERLVADAATGCLNWTGSVTHGGYGVLGVGRTGPGTRVRAHRLAYEEVNGPIPEGLVVDHLCRNPRCCNPDHLEAVTMRENTLRGEGASAKAATATHCAKGHPFSEDNTLVVAGPYGLTRRCKSCAADRQRRYRAAKAGAKQ